MVKKDGKIRAPFLNPRKTKIKDYNNTLRTSSASTRLPSAFCNLIPLKSSAIGTENKNFISGLKIGRRARKRAVKKTSVYLYQFLEDEKGKTTINADCD